MPFSCIGIVVGLVGMNCVILASKDLAGMSIKVYGIPGIFVIHHQSLFVNHLLIAYRIIRFMVVILVMSVSEEPSEICKEIY